MQARDSIRPSDCVARVGGEEFMVLLPQTKLDAARVVADRLRRAMARASFESGVHRMSAVTVSIGAAQFGRDGDSIEAVLRVADERLYDAKHQGRNRVVSA
jgi:diguanylate cyclase (GGDEF)-like protein